MSFSTGPVLREDVLVPGGLTKRVYAEGSGDSSPPPGCDVEVHYTGRLTNGTVFDSSVTRGEPFKFKIGLGNVIKGWDQGVASMKIGEKAVLECAPDFAYGSAGSPPTIPANSTLLFEVELLGFSEFNVVDNTDGLVKKKSLEVGSGYTYPNDSSSVMILIQGHKMTSEEKSTASAAPFLDHSDESSGGLEMLLGEDPDMSIGLEEAIKSMKQKERAVFIFQNDEAMGYSTALSQKYSLSRGDRLLFNIKLISFTKAKEAWEMNFDEKVQHMTRIKDIGNKYFKANKFHQAYARYKSCVDLFQHEKSLVGEELKRVNAVRVAALTNACIVRFKERAWNKVIEKANEALEFDPYHVKCLFKRAQAYTATETLDLAERDFKKCLELDPTNGEAKKELAALRSLVKAALAKERKTFGGWFNKVTLVTPEEEAANAAKSKAKDLSGGGDGSGSIDTSDDEFEADAEPAPMPVDKVANPPLPVEDGPQEMSVDSPKEK